MNVVKVQIHMVFADCPDCGESLLDPNDGSTAIKVCEHKVDDEYECCCCGEKFTLDKKIYTNNIMESI